MFIWTINVQAISSEDSITLKSIQFDVLGNSNRIKSTGDVEVTLIIKIQRFLMRLELQSYMRFEFNLSLTSIIDVARSNCERTQPSRRISIKSGLILRKILSNDVPFVPFHQPQSSLPRYSPDARVAASSD